MNSFNKTLLAGLTLVSVFSGIAFAQAPVTQAPVAQNQAPLIAPLPSNIVAGKLISITHEKVTVHNAWLDKVTLKVDSCDAPGTIKTVFYSPGIISDTTALGALFGQNYAAALMPNLERLQQSPNGLGLFWVDANGRILRTGLLGSQTGCKEVPTMIQQFR